MSILDSEFKNEAKRLLACRWFGHRFNWENFTGLPGPSGLAKECERCGFTKKRIVFDDKQSRAWTNRPQNKQDAWNTANAQKREKTVRQFVKKGGLYPSPWQIEEINRFALREIKVKKKDAFQTRAWTPLWVAAETFLQTPGSHYDRAAVLLKQIAKGHFFASANRRTAFLTAAKYLTDNGVKIGVENDSIQANVLTGMREGFYQDSEIAHWLKTGKIRPFQRRFNAAGRQKTRKKSEKKQDKRFE